MKLHIKLAFIVLLLLGLDVSAWAATSAAPDPTAMSPLAVLRQSAPSCGGAQALFSLAQVSQTDCCKGHQGVCGCRAGKIVCCDNTKSETCTCHADSGVDN
jgi:hypothetical protein